MKKTINYLLTGIAATSIALTSCSDNNSKLPAIDGYNNSNEVAKTNLVAHWTFDDTNNEDISKTAPAKTYGSISSITGKIGKALKLDSGALVFPSIAAINDANALNNYTVSMWVQLSGTKGGTGYFSPIFSLAPTTVSDIWPDIFLGAETGRHSAASDTLELKILMNTHPGGVKDQEDNIAQINPNATGTDAGSGQWFKKTGDWTHFVASWNSATHKFKIYANGASVGAYDTRANTGAEVLATPVQAIFGSFPSKDLGFASAPEVQGWAGLVRASVDDARIYNSALSDAEITALYNLGTAGR
jgi:hypothetical protein